MTIIIKKYKSMNCEVGIAKISKTNQKKWKMKKYEAVWKDKKATGSNEWWSFGGSVGFNLADFDTIKEAEKFIKKGLRQEKKNPEIWLEMVYIG